MIINELYDSTRAEPALRWQAAWLKLLEAPQWTQQVKSLDSLHFQNSYAEAISILALTKNFNSWWPLGHGMPRPKHQVLPWKLHSKNRSKHGLESES